MNESILDDAKIRTRLDAWLATRLTALGTLRVLRIDRPASAGIASETLLLETEMGQHPGPGLVVRLNRDNALYPDSDLRLHAHMYERVGLTSSIPVPRVHAVELDCSILGHPFMVVERLAGRAPPDRPNFNFHGWLCDLSAEDRATVWREAVATMSAFHSLSSDQFPELKRRIKTADGLRASLDYWIGYGNWCHGFKLPIMRKAAEWLHAHLPPTSHPSRQLSWGDARLQNLLFDGTRCTGLLDWDMVSLAGAEADLAWWALADHKNTASRGKSRLEGLGSPAETIRLWESMSGRKTMHFDWHLVFASFRQALITIRLIEITSGKNALFENGTEAPIGIQWISCLLGIPLHGELTQPFVGLEK